MAHTVGQRMAEAEEAGHSMTALPDELLLRVLEHAMAGRYGPKRWRGAVRGVSRRWRALHDGACTSLHLRNGVTDEGMHGLCGRLPALTHLYLSWVTSLTAEGLRAVGGLTMLTFLNLGSCPNVTDAVLWELRDLTALSTLALSGCTRVTDVGLQHLASLPALTELFLGGTSTTQTGRNALKASLPALTLHLW